jgi:hypothetical protein
MLLKKLFGKGQTKISPEIEYLNQSVSIHDLERRQREIENGLFRR